MPLQHTSLIVYKIAILSILILLKDTMHIYQLVLWLDMGLLHTCLEEQHQIVSERSIIKVFDNVILNIVPGAVIIINTEVLSASTVQLTWLTVSQQNINITHYIVSVSLYEGEEIYNGNVNVSSDLHVIVNKFGECCFLHLI